MYLRVCAYICTSFSLLPFFIVFSYLSHPLSHKFHSQFAFLVFYFTPFTTTLPHTFSPPLFYFSPSFSPPGTLLSEAVVTHLGTSLVQSTCAQPQPYVQSPSPLKEESREKGGGNDIIYPTPLLTKHVKFSGKVRTMF